MDTCRESGVSRLKLLGRHHFKAETAGRLCGKAEASVAGNVVVLAYARTPR
jgi:hypothetical protein